MQCKHKVTWSQQRESWRGSKLKTDPRTVDRSTGAVMSNSGAIHKHGSKSWISPLLDTPQQLVSSLAMVRRLRVYNCAWQSNRSQHAIEPHIGWQSRSLPSPHAFDICVRGSPSGCCRDIWYGTRTYSKHNALRSSIVTPWHWNLD